jgi:hypothetical protein
MRFILGLTAGVIRFVFRVVSLGLLLIVLAAVSFVYVRGNQPMQVSQVPAGMTYWQFMADRLDAAQEVEPRRCGVGRFATFAFLAPVYSIVYVDIGLHPGGFLDRVSQEDRNIPTGVEDTAWSDIPDAWWGVVERISWSMLARPAPACNFRPVKNGVLDD